MPGKRCDYSQEVVEKGKQILEGSGAQYLGRVCRREVAEKVEILSGMVTVLMDHLKKDKSYDPELERMVRQVVARSMQKGFAVGKKYAGTPEELMRTITLIPVHPNKMIAELPARKRKLAKYVMHSVLLGKFAYETGLAVSATLTQEGRTKYLKKLEEETSAYIT